MNGATEAPVWLGGGWFSGARAVRSPNLSARPPGAQVDIVVIHSISLPPGRYGGDAVERLFTNRLVDFEAHPYYERLRGVKVSSHFLIRRDAQLVQFVGCDDKAWHAGESAWHGRRGCNDFSVGIELEGLEGLRFEDGQYDALVLLLRALAVRYPIHGVAGHEHVAPGRKRDPGAGFDWARLCVALDWPARYFPEAIVPGR